MQELRLIRSFMDSSICNDSLFTDSINSSPFSGAELECICPTDQQRALAVKCIEWIESTYQERVHSLSIALGSGSTSEAFVLELASWAKKNNWQGCCIASSKKTARLAKTLGLSLMLPTETPEVMVDGADFITPTKEMIKGYGGALFREKLLAHRARNYCILLQSAKLVTDLYPHSIPVEVVPFAAKYLLEQWNSNKNWQATLRKDRGELFITDNNNYICDLLLESHERSLTDINNTLKLQTGVVETGLFTGLSPTVFVEKEGLVEKNPSFFR